MSIADRPPGYSAARPPRCTWLGWAGVVTAPALVHRPLIALLFGLGGIAYTAGAALFASGRPRLNPRWFGYHEAWHTFVVAAGALMFAANFMLVRNT